MARRHDYISEVDEFIGKKIYNLRLARGFSREKLGKAICVTQQQIQKYEDGSNRMSAGRLVLIAKALGKTPEFFYEGLGNDYEPIITQHQRMCLEVSRNFMKLSSARYKEAVNTLLRSLAKEAA